MTLDHGNYGTFLMGHAGFISSTVDLELQKLPVSQIMRGTSRASVGRSVANVRVVHKLRL